MLCRGQECCESGPWLTVLHPVRDIVPAGLIFLGRLKGIGGVSLTPPSEHSVQIHAGFIWNGKRSVPPDDDRLFVPFQPPLHPHLFQLHGEGRWPAEGEAQ